MGRPADCSCGCSGPPLWIDYRRSIDCLGPLTEDTTIPAHTQDWRWDGVWGGHFNGSRNYPVWSWFSHPSPVLNTTTKMIPIRFSIAVPPPSFTFLISSDLYYSTMPSRRKPSLLTAPATADGHFSGSKTTSIKLERCLFSTNLSATASKIVAARLIVDGDDISGAVTVNVPFTNNGNGSYRWGRWWSDALSFNVPSTVISSSQSMFVDVWVEFISGSQNLSQINESTAVGIVPSDGYAAPLIAAHGSFSPYGFLPLGPILTPGQIDIHKRLRLSNTWTMTFTGGTVGGATSLVMEPQSGWSYSRQGPVVQMVKTSGAGTADRVRLRYDTETPEVHIQLKAMLDQEINMAGGINNGWTRYSIYSPSYYSPETVSNEKLGPITASGANTFLPISRGAYHTGGFGSGNGVSWQPWEQTLAAQRTGFPTSISVERL